MSGTRAAPIRLVGTNLKMAMMPSQVGAYARELAALTADVEDTRLFILPSYPALPAAAAALTGSRIAWGAQDVDPYDGGAHTGMVSAPMLADVGCTYVQVGHVERRRDLGESDARIGAKAAAVQRAGMTPLLCVGELSPADLEDAFGFVREQLRAVVEHEVDLDDALIAYEPAWAIGEGARSASPQWIAQMHARIRAFLDGRAAHPDRVPLLTGGSVDAHNARALAEPANVDGLFVGRHALDVQAFSQIIHSVS